MRVFACVFLPWFQKLHYDLGDCTAWEFMFPSNDQTQTQPANDAAANDDKEDEDADVEVVICDIVSTILGIYLHTFRPFLTLHHSLICVMV